MRLPITFPHAPLAAGVALIAIATCPAETITDAKITEFVADNGDGIRDEDGDRSDWLEIWNASGVAGDLGGWHLTDDPDNLTKWTLPAIPITSGGYVVVFASGKNRPAPAGEAHTNFRIQSGAGGYLALVEPDGVTIATVFENYPEQFADKAYGLGFETETPVTFFVAGAQAKWHVPSGPVAGWTETGFDDAAWSAGATGIGFDGGSDYDHLFGAGGDVAAEMRGINPTVYIRVAFEVPDPTGIGDVKLRLKWEDGFVAHLNGTEFHREGAPSNPAWNSIASSGNRDETDAQTFFEYPVDQGGLVQGTNVLAIQGLNSSLGSSDVLFVPELVGIFQDVENLVEGFFPEPTPRSENGMRFDGIVGDTRFSVGRGFYENPIDVAITTVTEGATIRYTLDGTPPSQTDGTVYTGPVRIDGTTVLRAMAYKPGFEPTNIDTLTYIFPEDVVEQTKMRSAITESATYGPQMIDSLKAVPTISLVTENTGFENESASNIRTEHQTSIEMIFPDGTPGFQEDGGLSNYGGRFTNFRKKSFRVAFRSEFGTTKLKYPIFDGFDYQHFPPAEEFDVINLRSGSHDMQSRGAYMSNRFTDDSMLDMGNIGPHGRFVHVYLNGNYWGQYHLRERWSADMASSYFGGPEEDYEAVNANDNFQNDEEVYDGPGDFWRETKTLVAGSNPFENAADHIDVANIIDFMLLWVSGDSESEFRSFGSESRGVPFKFMIKDADGFLRSPPPGKATHAGPLSVMSRMRNGAGRSDYEILLADRIHKHFFNDGALTVEKNIERLQRRVDEARPGFISEAARWGNLFREPQSWEAYQTNLLNNHFRNLTQTMIDRFKAANMYPDIIAPVLNQHGGSIAPGAGITMATNALAIYYTLDGSDPRLSGGAVNPAATLAPFANDIRDPEDFVVSGAIWKYLDDGSDQGTAWRATNFDDSAWASGPSELGYGENEATTISFGPSAASRYATTYFRHQADVSKPAEFSWFVIGLQYDDGAAVYVNGTEVVRTDNLPVDAAFDTYTTARTPDENTFFQFVVPSSHFVDGANTIAVELHQESPGSSDTSFDLTLRGEIDTSNGNNITEPIILTDPAQFNARAYNSGTNEWSALTSTFFTIGTVPASAANLAISEIHYHPAEPTLPGEIAISTDRDDYEFIELLNTSQQPIALTGVHFNDGITFSFPENTTLAGRTRVVLVRNIAAFTERYGGHAASAIAGQYSGRLSNDGEQITLSRTGVGALHNLVYNDQPPWPVLADGHGYSMVLVDVNNNPEHAVAANWLPHAMVGGAPGTTDSVLMTTYTAWKADNNVVDNDSDDDGDRITAFGEYGFGSDPATANTRALPRPAIVSNAGADYLAITFEKNLLATDVIYQVQASTNLTTWTDAAAAVLVSENVNPDDLTSTVTYRSATPTAPGARQFLRLKLSLIK